MEEKRITISIIIPVYNVEKYIAQCLDSVYGQDLDGVEIILVNDGSTDGSLSICEQYAQAHADTKLISQENGGLSAARNTGISNANGEYLLFLDSDDWLAENAISELKSVLNKNGGVDIVFGKPVCYNEATGDYEQDAFGYFGEYQKYRSPSELFCRLLKRKDFWFAAWLCIVNRKFIVDNNLLFERGIFHEDELWVPQIMLKAKSVCLWNDSFYCYRTNRSNSIISNKNIKKELDKAHIIDRLLPEYKTADKYGRAIVKDRAAALEWGLIINYGKFTDDERADELYKAIKKQLGNLKHGKYRLVYWYIKAVSLDRYLKRK